MSTDKDLNVFLSLSAETTVIKDSIHYAKESQSHTVLITQNDHYRNKNKIDLAFILPAFQLDKKNIFVDSQALVFLTIDLIINNLASHLREQDSHKIKFQHKYLL